MNNSTNIEIDISDIDKMVKLIKGKQEILTLFIFFFFDKKDFKI